MGLPLTVTGNTHKSDGKTGCGHFSIKYTHQLIDGVLTATISELNFNCFDGYQESINNHCMKEPSYVNVVNDYDTNYDIYGRADTFQDGRVKFTDFKKLHIFACQFRLLSVGGYIRYYDSGLGRDIWISTFLDTQGLNNGLTINYDRLGRIARIHNFWHGQLLIENGYDSKTISPIGASSKIYMQKLIGDRDQLRKELQIVTVGQKIPQIIDIIASYTDT